MMIGLSLTLADGRTLGYAEYGDPAGQPIFIFLNANSRRFYPFDDAIARGLKARLINVERPGIGYSSPQPDRTLLDWAGDIRQLADDLALDHFALVGVGSGGPHAAACAVQLGDRVRALGLVSAPSPPEAPARRVWWREALAALRARLNRQPPPLTHDLIRQNSIKAWQNFHLRLPACDREVVQHYGPRYLKPSFMRDVYDELYRQGIEGLTLDDALMTQPWGFSPANISVPAQVWHGEADTLTPLSMGRYFAKHIPHSQPHFLPGEGHLLYLKRWREILANVL